MTHFNSSSDLMQRAISIGSCASTMSKPEVDIAIAEPAFIRSMPTLPPRPISSISVALIPLAHSFSFVECQALQQQAGCHGCSDFVDGFKAFA
eukprot:TRINITY_DN19370_c0_g1_i1.p1 TRINITY_DN19370_c0_g1~~TRINITY_DN19370_c0_g1_i1.p1  ORF type:complete len:106 (+),score=5.26 TRINITY_DN19370_c0_g1_i1:40-318(+)